MFRDVKPLSVYRGTERGVCCEAEVACRMSQQATANPKWSAAQVSEYLAKWQVEEVVQQAVNSAIRHKPDDPVLHIADFLEARGRAIEQQSQKSTDTQ